MLIFRKPLLFVDIMHYHRLSHYTTDGVLVDVQHRSQKLYFIAMIYNILQLYKIYIAIISIIRYTLFIYSLCNIIPAQKMR